MTHEELWSAFPRPWRLMEEEPGVVLCADGGEALSVHGGDTSPEEDGALAEIVMDLVNGERDERQREIAGWAARTFGADQASSVPQRGLRLLEEAIEAAQAAGVDRAMAHKLLDFVYERPVGDLRQEIGGVGLTLLCLAEAAWVSADVLERAEIERVKAKPIEHFRARNQAKNDAGFYALLDHSKPSA